MQRMRSVSAMIVAGALALCALVALCGCTSGSEGQAAELLEKADGLYNVSTGIGTELDTLKAEIEHLMVANDIAGLEAKQTVIEDMLKNIDRSMSQLDKAIPLYQHVTRLKGVDKYKEYASLEMEAALKEQQALAISRDLVNYVLGVIADAKSGKPVSLTDSLRSVSTTVNRLDELEREIDEAKREAKALAQENKLF